MIGLEAEIYRWFKTNNELKQIDDIYDYFSFYSSYEVKSALNRLCNKDVLYNVDTYVGNMYGLTGNDAIEFETPEEKTNRLKEEQECKKRAYEREYREKNKKRLILDGTYIPEDDDNSYIANCIRWKKKSEEIEKVRNEKIQEELSAFKESKKCVITERYSEET